MAQIMKFMSRAEALEGAAYNAYFVGEHERRVRALSSLLFEQLTHMWQHIKAAKG